MRSYREFKKEAQEVGDISALRKIINIRNIQNNWIDGNLRNNPDMKINLKIFSEPSKYGIDEGRISKLWIKDNNTKQTLVNYDRGWDVVPTGEVIGIVNNIVESVK